MVLGRPESTDAGCRVQGSGRAFARDEVRQAVIPAYMGLIKQIDDCIGKLMAFLEAAGRLDDTMIVCLLSSINSPLSPTKTPSSSQPVDIPNPKITSPFDKSYRQKGTR